MWGLEELPILCSRIPCTVIRYQIREIDLKMMLVIISEASILAESITRAAICELHM